MTLANVAEVKECGQRYANQLLAAGYPLLYIGCRTVEIDRRAKNAGASTFVRFDTTYVIGRSGDQEPFPAPAPREEVAS